ncbi:MAG: NAD(P)H-dependent amine dehydrogenase family protein [Phycisphaerae bacterium]
MIRVIQLGLGEIGRRTIDALLVQSKHARLVGAVDINPAFIGKSLREVMGGSKNIPPLTVSGSLRDLLRRSRGSLAGSVAIMTTGSRTDVVKKTVEELIAAGIHTVSSCEELAFPTLRNPRMAAALDKAAKKKGVAILGTGVNPGYAMDAFALACTAPCTVVNHIRIIRNLDACKRRLQLQKKVGAGMSVAEVKKLIRNKEIGHVGLAESVAMIAAGLHWKLDSIREKFEPVVADHPVSSEFIHIQPGQVRGMWMRADGYVNGKKKIELDLLMAFDADTFDEVIIDGIPPLLVRTKSGFPGEASTISMLVNCARIAPTLEPGMRTMMDVLRVRSVGA